MEAQIEAQEGPPVKRRKKKNSRAKGAGFERDIARDLRAWLGPAWTVVRNQTDRQKGQVDDIAGEFTVLGPARFPFAIECKAHESFHEGQLFAGEPTPGVPWSGPGPLDKWWTQATAQAESCVREPMLIVKRNNGPILVVLNTLGEDLLAWVPGGWRRRLLLGDGRVVLPWAQVLHGARLR